MSDVEVVGEFLRERRPFILAENFAIATWVATHLNLGKQHWRYVGSAWSLRGTRDEIVLVVPGWTRGCATTSAAQEILHVMEANGAHRVRIPDLDEYFVDQSPGRWLEQVVENLFATRPSEQEA